MGKYIKTFETHDEYEEYINDSECILPNVSYCKNMYENHYTPLDEYVIAIYDIIDIENATKLITNGSSYFTKMLIDGVVQNSIVDNYQFDTLGIHMVYFLPKDDATSFNGFNSCERLVRIKMTDIYTELSRGVFIGCQNLVSVTLSKNITYIPTNAFTSTKIPYLELPESITQINKHCLSNNLISLFIPKNVTTIDSGSLINDKNNLEEISVDNRNTVYDSRNNCNAIIETATNKLIAGCQNTVIPNSVTKLGLTSFEYCDGLTSIVIPNSVTEIATEVFQYCTNLGSIIIPDSVTTISNQVFLGCSGLTNVTIGSGVTTIYTGVFNDCTSLTSVRIKATIPPTLIGPLFENVSGFKIYVPAESVNDYKTANIWSTYAADIEAMTN